MTIAKKLLTVLVRFLLSLINLQIPCEARLLLERLFLFWRRLHNKILEESLTSAWKPETAGSVWYDFVLRFSPHAFWKQQNQNAIRFGLLNSGQGVKKIAGFLLWTACLFCKPDWNHAKMSVAKPLATFFSLNTQPFAALLSSPLQNLSSCPSFHPFPETVPSFSVFFLWLICSLHLSISALRV